MTEHLRAYLDEQMQAVNNGVRQDIELADGDVHRALRITLIANAFLQEKSTEDTIAELRKYGMWEELDKEIQSTRTGDR